MATPIYTFKDNQPKTEPLTAPKPQPTDPITGGQTINQTAPRPSFKDASTGTTTARSSFGDTLNDIPQQNVQAAQQAIGDQLKPQEGPSVSGQLARNSFEKSVDADRQAMLEQQAKMGRVGTGQIIGDLGQYTEQRLTPARMDFEQAMQAQEQQQVDTRRQQGIQNALGFEQLAAGERMQDKQIASTENIAFADLDLRDRALAQDAMQFGSSQEFQKWAIEQGWDQEAIGRAWQSAENQKQREFSGDQSALDRGLQKYIADKGFDLTAEQLGEEIRQFDSRLDFDRWATEQGFDETEKNRIHDLRMQDIQNKHARGERLEAQDHSLLIEDKRLAHDELMQQRDATLQLDSLEKQQAHQLLMQDTANTYENLRLDKTLSHNKAMTLLENELAAKLQAQGYDQETALQAARLETQAIENKRDRELQSALANAQLAQQYDFHMDNLGIRRKELDLTKDQVTQQMDLALKQFGLQEREVEALLGRQDVQDSLGTASLLFEMSEGNPDMEDMAVESMVKAVGKAQGMSQDETNAMLLNFRADKFDTPAELTTYAQEQGFSPAAIDSVIKANTAADGSWTGGGTGTSGSGDITITATKDDIAALPTGTQEFLSRVLNGWSTEDQKRSYDFTNKYSNVLDVDPKKLKSTSAIWKGKGWPVSEKPEALNFGTLAAIYDQTKDRRTAYELAALTLGQDAVDTGIKGMTNRDPAAWLEGK